MWFQVPPDMEGCRNLAAARSVVEFLCSTPTSGDPSTLKLHLVGATSASRKNRHRVSDQHCRCQSRRPRGPPNALLWIFLQVSAEARSPWSSQTDISQQMSEWPYRCPCDLLVTMEPLDSCPHDTFQTVVPMDRLGPRASSLTHVMHAKSLYMAKL